MGMFDVPEDGIYRMPVPIDRTIFDIQPRPQILQALSGIDPRAKFYREQDYKNFAEKFTVRWTTLGVYFGITNAVSNDMMIMDDQYRLEEYVTQHLMDTVISAIMEAYIEFWHLDYEGPLSLQEFTEMTGLEVFYYLDSNGEYIPGRGDYARVCRLQQRDAGRYTTPERIAREDL